MANEADVLLAGHKRYMSLAVGFCLLGPAHRTWHKALPCASDAPTIYLSIQIVSISRIDCMRFLPRCVKIRASKGVATNVEFLVAWWSRHEHKPVALHLLSGGAGEWVSHWEFGGISLGVDRASFAASAMRYIDPSALTLEQAKIVALKVLRDTIETSVEGIGGRVQDCTRDRSRSHSRGRYARSTRHHRLVGGPVH